MYNFEYYTPTFIEFGKKSEEKVAQLIKAQNGKKVLIHYGGHSAKKSGLIDKYNIKLLQKTENRKCSKPVFCSSFLFFRQK